MMKRTALVTQAILFATAAVAVGGSGGASVKIEIKGGGFNADTAEANGTLESTKAACIDGRKLELYMLEKGGKEERFDKVHSYESGDWSGEGPVKHGKRIGLKVVAPASDPPGAGKCAAGSERFIFPSGPFRGQDTNRPSVAKVRVVKKK
jgi:hypothetical protein